MIQNKCFATDDDGSCMILQEKTCIGIRCAFFKTEEQHMKDRRAAENKNLEMF